MQPWKINQRIFQALAIKNDVLGVHISNDKIRMVSGDLISAIDHQWVDLTNIWIPAKSYCVALVYGTELAMTYGGKVQEYINDKDLLPEDQYFCCYSNNSYVYDHFLQRNDWQNSPMALLIKQYYRKEILLEGLFQ